MKIEDSLESLGLTQIEALAYAYLVANPSSTGYRVARGIGKPTANVYRALESLNRKGAVLQDRAATPAFRALSPDDLLARLEDQFMQRKARAALELAALTPDEGDERLYSLTSLDQVLSRARILLASTRRVIAVDAAHDIAAMLVTEIQDARHRGARVLLRSRPVPVFAETSPDLAVPTHRDTMLDRSAPRGMPPALRVVCDAREVLLSWFSLEGGRVREAWWTRSGFVARAMHDALVSERFCLQIELGMADGLSVDDVESASEERRELLDMV
ncbi:MAG TPA: helix-turn-helix domain-containing protein [Candidatus Krumholzibacteria bacterium]